MQSDTYRLYIVLQISYKGVGKTQLNFLRLLSEKAVQNFTYYCSGSVAWYDNVAKSYEKAIRLQGDNDDVIGYQKNRFSIKVLHDGCQVRHDGYVS